MTFEGGGCGRSGRSPFAPRVLKPTFVLSEPAGSSEGGHAKAWACCRVFFARLFHVEHSVVRVAIGAEAPQEALKNGRRGAALRWSDTSVQRA